MTPDHGPAGTLDEYDVIVYDTGSVAQPPRFPMKHGAAYTQRAPPWIAAIIPSTAGLHVSTCLWARVYREIRKLDEERTAHK